MDNAFARAIATALTLTLSSLGAFAHEHTDIQVRDAWSKALPAVVPNGAVYFQIHNHGKDSDKLLSVRTARAGRAEIHTHVMEDGLMKMRHLEGGLAIAGKGTTQLAPGGHHIMLIKLTEPLIAGQQFAVTLNFEKAGKVAVQVNVLSLSDAAHQPKAGHGKGHGMHKHGTAN